MSSYEIGVVPHPDHTAVMLSSGETVSHRQLADFKRSPLYANADFRVGVDRLHQIAEHQKQMARTQRWLARRKP